MRGSPSATAAGLEGEHCLLLPSFLALLRQLKRDGRSFSVCFRTFGRDLGRLESEYNALCTDTHPLFPAEEGAPPLKMDGSDGAPDMRMDLSGNGTSCGAFFRASSGTPEEDVKLAFGVIQRPRAFYDKLGAAFPSEKAAQEEADADWAVEAWKQAGDKVVVPGQDVQSSASTLLNLSGDMRLGAKGPRSWLRGGRP